MYAQTRSTWSDRKEWKAAHNMSKRERDREKKVFMLRYE